MPSRLRNGIVVRFATPALRSEAAVRQDVYSTARNDPKRTFDLANILCKDCVWKLGLVAAFAVRLGTKRTRRLPKTGFVTVECASDGQAVLYRLTLSFQKSNFGLPWVSPNTTYLRLDSNEGSAAIAGHLWCFDQLTRTGFPSRQDRLMIRK